MSTLKVATVAFETAWKDVNTDLRNFEKDVKKVLKIYPETQIILFPEITFMGYTFDESNQELAESLEGHVVSEVKRIAKENNVAIIAGMWEENDSGKSYNTQFVISKNGDLIIAYRKNHLFTASPEPKVVRVGDNLAMFNFAGWKCGLATCFDIRFPRLFETYKQQGVECVFMGFKWVDGRNKPMIREALVKARATENQMFMVTVDSSGIDPNTSYSGITVISNPYAEEISKTDGIYSYAELDKNEITTLDNSLPLSDSFKEDYSVEQ